MFDVNALVNKMVFVAHSSLTPDLHFGVVCNLSDSFQVSVIYYITKFIQSEYVQESYVPN